MHPKKPATRVNLNSIQYESFGLYRCYYMCIHVFINVEGVFIVKLCLFSCFTYSQY